MTSDKFDPFAPYSTTHIINTPVFETVARAGQNVDFLLFGDTNHTSSSVNSFLSNEHFIKSIAEAGCLHLCLEVPTQLNDLGQQYYNGEITREDFERIFTERSQLSSSGGEVTLEAVTRRIADSIDYAKKYGMQVHFVDDAESGAEIDRQLNRRATNTIYQEIKPLLDIQQCDDPDMVAAELKKGYNEALIIRTKDEGLYQNIMEATNGEKFAFIVGSDHDQIATKLSQQGTLFVMDIFPNTQEQYFHQYAMEPPENATREGQPQITYAIEQNMLGATEHLPAEQLGTLDAMSLEEYRNQIEQTPKTEPQMSPQLN